MPEHEIDGGEIWLHPDETVVQIVDLGRRNHIGLVTARADGRYYASVLRLSDKPGYRFDVPRWNFRGMERSICESVAGAEGVIRSFAREEFE
jgi:hypothetical protein